MSRRNPKGMSLSPEQEAEYERYEMLLARARIYELGVAAILNGGHGEYLSTVESAETSRVLVAAIELRAEALAGRQNIRLANTRLPAGIRAKAPKKRSASA
jgi:hypothetical protein